MRHNKKQTIKLETSYDLDTLPKTIYRIIAQLKWQRYALERINKKERDYKKRNQLFHTTILPLLLGFVALLGIVVPIIVGIQTTSVSSAFVALAVIVVGTVVLLVLLDTRARYQRNTLKDRRAEVTQRVEEILTPDMARFLQVDLPITPTPIAIDELVRVYHNAQAFAALIHTLKMDYKAKTIFNISPLDEQHVLKNASQYTTSILYQDENDTMCILAVNVNQTHYYEFNESTKAFDYIPDGILFIKDDADLSE